MKEKILIIALAIILCVGLTGCGEKSSSNAEKSSSNAEKSKVITYDKGYTFGDTIKTKELTFKISEDYTVDAGYINVPVTITNVSGDVFNLERITSINFDYYDPAGKGSIGSLLDWDFTDKLKDGSSYTPSFSFNYTTDGEYEVVLDVYDEEIDEVKYEIKNIKFDIVGSK